MGDNSATANFSFAAEPLVTFGNMFIVSSVLRLISFEFTFLRGAFVRYVVAVSIMNEICP